PIFDVLTRQDGLDLPSMEEQREADILRVEDAMQPSPGPVLDSEDSIDEVWKEIEKLSNENLLVRLSPTGWSSTTKQEVKTMVSEGKGDLILGSVLAGRAIPYLHPDQ